MSRSEKRYFKIYIRTHSSKHENDYIQLFGLVDDQEIYNEAEVISAMEKKGPFQRFTVLKHRLFEKILDALESFQRSNDEGMRLNHEISRATVLLKRGMKRAGLNMLNKILQQARAIEAHAIALRAIESIERHGEEIIEDTQSILDNVARRLELRDIHVDLRERLRVEGKEATSIDELLVKIDSQPVSSSIRNTYLSEHMRATVQYAHGQHAACLDAINECLTMLNDHGYLLGEMPLATSDMLANKLYCLLELSEPLLARASLQVLVEMDTTELRPHQLLRHDSNLLQSILMYLDVHSDIGLEKALEAMLAPYEAQRWNHAPLVRAAIDFGLAIHHQSCGESGKALRSLNRVLNDGEVSRDEDIYHRTLVLMTLLHAESGDREWMVHSARALKRYLRPRNLLTGVEAALLDYISALRRSRSPEGERNALISFRDRLTILRDSEKIVFDYFNMLAWAELRLAADENQSLVA